MVVMEEEDYEENDVTNHSDDTCFISDSKDNSNIEKLLPPVAKTKRQSRLDSNSGSTTLDRRSRR